MPQPAHIAHRTTIGRGGCCVRVKLFTWTVFVLVSSALTVGSGCAKSDVAIGPAHDGGGNTFDGPNPTTCPPCVTDNDCSGGGACAQFQGDTFCAPTCPNGNECSSDRTCTPETSASGNQVSVCVPNNNLCGQSL